METQTSEVKAAIIAFEVGKIYKCLDRKTTRSATIAA